MLEAGAYYSLTIKDNCPAIRERIEARLPDPGSPLLTWNNTQRRTASHCREEKQRQWVALAASQARALHHHRLPRRDGRRHRVAISLVTCKIHAFQSQPESLVHKSCWKNIFGIYFLTILGKAAGLRMLLPLSSRLKIRVVSPVVTPGVLAGLWFCGGMATHADIVGWSPSGPIELSVPATGAAVAGTGGATNVNELLGANRYYSYSTPITGQNSITYNMEAGHIWNGHEALSHVTQFSNTPVGGGVAGVWGDGTVGPLIDRHATAVAMLIGGRPTNSGSPDPAQSGVAPNTNLRSAAFAQNWSDNAYSLSFGLNIYPYLYTLNAAFGTADVVNSSFGYDDPSGGGGLTNIGDAYAWQNPYTTWVNSVGNSGPATNTVVAPASGYNTISVGALTRGSDPANPYNTVASFSSRGPESFEYGNNVIVSGVRAAVDIVAPGDELKSAYYGGVSGGNNSSLTGSPSGPAGTASSYSESLAGTSYAAPLVAGGAALVASAANTLTGLSDNPYATHSMVVKSLLRG